MECGAAAGGDVKPDIEVNIIIKAHVNTGAAITRGPIWESAGNVILKPAVSLSLAGAEWTTWRLFMEGQPVTTVQTVGSVQIPSAHCAVRVRVRSGEGLESAPHLLGLGGRVRVTRGWLAGWVV